MVRDRPCGQDISLVRSESVWRGSTARRALDRVGFDHFGGRLLAFRSSEYHHEFFEQPKVVRGRR